MAAVLIGGAALLAAPAWASAAPITFNFGDCTEITGPSGFLCPNADSGKATLTYKSGGLTVTTYGYLISPITGADLYVKQGGSAVETGLGIAAEGSDHEIDSRYVVDLDVSNLSAHGITRGDVTLSSVQTDEHFMVCVEGAAGSVATNSSCITGMGGNVVTLHNFGPWSNTNHFIAITSGGEGDILVASSLVATVPEPATMVLFGTGAMGLALIRRRLGGRGQP